MSLSNRIEVRPRYGHQLYIIQKLLEGFHYRVLSISLIQQPHGPLLLFHVHVVENNLLGQLQGVDQPRLFREPRNVIDALYALIREGRR